MLKFIYNNDIDFIESIKNNRDINENYDFDNENIYNLDLFCQRIIKAINNKENIGILSDK